MNYGKAIRTARSIADRSQEDVAGAASINRSYLSSIESGRRIPSIATLEALSEALKVPIHLLQLLGAETGDLLLKQDEHVKNLALELTKLILQGKNDEFGGNPTSSRNAKSTRDQKPKRSRIKAAARSRAAS